MVTFLETEMTSAERMKKNMDERLEKQKEKKEEEEKQAEIKKEKSSGSVQKLSLKNELPGNEKLDISIKYVEAESEEEAEIMIQNKKMKDVYYPGFAAEV